MKCSSYCVSLALFSLALPLMTGSLSSKQKQSAESYGASEAASGSTEEPEQNSNEICAPGAHATPIAAAMETTVACMSQAAVQNQTHLRSYTVTREYELFGQKRDKARSRVFADVTFRPPDSKNYRIQETEGSVIGEKVVRLVLEREAALAKNGGASDISQDNYDFQFVREELVSGRRCYVLQLLPKRKDKNLLRGTVWVDADTYLIRRTEGEPQKSPSWWLRDVHIAFVYARVGEMWLPTSAEFTAKVRLFGMSTMLAHDLGYSYYSQLAGAGTIPAACNTQLAQQRIAGGGPPSQPSKTE
jgi:Outer membrane lipoprotein-sorting protein